MLGGSLCRCECHGRRTQAPDGYEYARSQGTPIAGICDGSLVRRVLVCVLKRWRSTFITFDRTRHVRLSPQVTHRPGSRCPADFRDRADHGLAGQCRLTALLPAAASAAWWCRACADGMRTKTEVSARSLRSKRKPFSSAPCKRLGVGKAICLAVAWLFGDWPASGLRDRDLKRTARHRASG